MSFSDPEPREGEADDRRGPEARLPMSLLRPPAAESSPRASGIDPEEIAEPQASLESQELGIPASPTVPWPRRLESPTSSRFAALRAAAASGVPLDPAAELPDWRHEPRSTDWGSLAALRSGLVRVEAADLAASQEVRSLQARVAAGEKRLEEAKERDAAAEAELAALCAELSTVLAQVEDLGVAQPSLLLTSDNGVARAQGVADAVQDIKASVSAAVRRSATEASNTEQFKAEAELKSQHVQSELEEMQRLVQARRAAAARAEELARQKAELQRYVVATGNGAGTGDRRWGGV